MSSSIGLAHWTVELECDTLFIMEGCVAKDNDKAKELGLTESEQVGSWRRKKKKRSLADSRSPVW